MPDPGKRRSRRDFALAEAATGDLAVVRTLFREYASWLGEDLSFQGFDEELKTLPGKYSPPDGTILLAWDGEAAAGCVALRRFDASRCEMKRLWVRETYRGRGLGRQLVEHIIAEARSIGYGSMVLDTLSSMPEALGLYQSSGFTRISPYYDNPLPGAVYLTRSL